MTVLSQNSQTCWLRMLSVLCLGVATTDCTGGTTVDDTPMLEALKALARDTRQVGKDSRDTPSRVTEEAAKCDPEKALAVFTLSPGSWRVQSNHGRITKLSIYTTGAKNDRLEYLRAFPDLKELKLTP